MSVATVRRLLLALAAVGAVVGVVGVVGSLDWPIVHDAALMHYLGWRIWEGDRPWVDVLDVNLPATYLLHAGWHGLFDGSALAWRLLDLGLLGAGAAAVTRILWPRGRAVAAVGAVAVVLLHLGRGAEAVGQRDFVVGVLELVATASLIGWYEVRRGAWWRLGGAGLALGWCLATKPSAVGFVVLAAVAMAVVGRRDGLGWGRLAGAAAWVAGGAAVVLGASLLWVAQLGVLDAMLAFWTTYMPLYREVLALPPAELLLRLRETPSAALLPLAGVHLWTAGRRDPARAALLLAGVVGGALHFVLQGKGYTYHLEPYAFFLVPAGLLDLERAWSGAPWRTVGPLTAAGLVLCLGLSSWWTLTDDGIDETQLAAANRLATEAPGHTVMVMDLAQGGVQGLFEARVPQHSRFLYDFYWYHDVFDARIRAYRDEAIAGIEADPPDRIALFEQAWPARTYRRVETFRALERILRKDYVLLREADGYRWYAREDTLTP